jgi:hypothetical protein
MKKIVYSALVGEYDNFPKIEDTSDWDCVLFTDRQHSGTCPTNWSIKKIDKAKGRNNSFINRWYKMHPHILFPNHEVSLYIDSNIYIKKFDYINQRVEKFIEKGVSISAPKHFLRNDIYSEAVEILNCQRDSLTNILKTVIFLRKEGYPKNNGLLENSFLFRLHHDPGVKIVMEKWWKFINSYSYRDQMSLCYLLWKYNIPLEHFFEDGSNCRDRNDVIYCGEHNYVELEKNVLWPILSLLKMTITYYRKLNII